MLLHDGATTAAADEKATDASGSTTSSSSKTAATIGGTATSSAATSTNDQRNTRSQEADQAAAAGSTTSSSAKTATTTATGTRSPTPKATSNGGEGVYPHSAFIAVAFFFPQDDGHDHDDEVVTTAKSSDVATSAGSGPTNVVHDDRPKTVKPTILAPAQYGGSANDFPSLSGYAFIDANQRRGNGLGGLGGRQHRRKAAGGFQPELQRSYTTE